MMQKIRNLKELFKIHKKKLSGVDIFNAANTHFQMVYCQPFLTD